MFSLQQALGKEDKFFELLEASAEQARASVQALIKFFQSTDATKSLDEFADPRRREKAINAEIVESLATQVMTAFEREDVEALSKALYKIPKTVEKIGERILMAPQFLAGVDLSKEIAALGQAANILLVMVRELRRRVPVEDLKRHNGELQHIEGEVDKMTTDLLRGLYLSQTDVGRALFLKDLYELLERVTDRCRDAGNVIIQIALKSA
jgi:uncharacterized protein Yka (UPF0111/DUF47 family)